MRIMAIVVVMLYVVLRPSGAGTLMKTDHSPESGTEAEIRKSNDPTGALNYRRE